MIYLRSEAKLWYTGCPLCSLSCSSWYSPRLPGYFSDDDPLSYLAHSNWRCIDSFKSIGYLQIVICLFVSMFNHLHHLKLSLSILKVMGHRQGIISHPDIIIFSRTVRTTGTTSWVVIFSFIINLSCALVL